MSGSLGLALLLALAVALPTADAVAETVVRGWSGAAAPADGYHVERRGFRSDGRRLHRNPYASSADRRRLHRDPYEALQRGYGRHRDGGYRSHDGGRGYGNFDRGEYRHGYRDGYRDGRARGDRRFGIRGGAGRYRHGAEGAYRSPGTQRPYRTPEPRPGARHFDGPVLHGPPSVPGRLSPSPYRRH